MADTVRQAELSQGEACRVYRGCVFAVICSDRVSDIESKRFVSSRLVWSSPLSSLVSSSGLSVIEETFCPLLLS